MKRMMGCAAVLAAVVAMAPVRVDAQQARRRMQGPGAEGAVPGPGIEMILRQRERLELSQSQIDQLDKLRADAVKQRSAHQAQMAELRSKVLAGEMKPEELRSTMQAQREGAADVRKQERERIESVLNDAQKQKIQTWLGQARAFRMGRMSAQRGQGRGGQGRVMRGGRGPGGRMGPGGGMGRGMMGPGMRGGPGMGRGFAPGAMRGPWMRGGPGGDDDFAPPMLPPPDSGSAREGS